MAFLPVNESPVYSFAFSADGKTIAVGLLHGVLVWDVAARKRLVAEPFAVKEGIATSMAFSPDGKTIATGYSHNPRDGRVVLWDVAAGKRLIAEPLAVKEGNLTSMAFSPDGKTIATGYDYTFGGGVVLWDVAARKRMVDKPLTVKEGGVSSVAFSPDGKTIAAGYRRVAGRQDRGGVVLWDADARKRLVDEPLAVDEGGVVRLALSADGKIVAVGYLNERPSSRSSGVVLWDLASRERLVAAPLSVMGWIQSMGFSLDGKTIGVGYITFHPRERRVMLWDVTARKCLVDESLAVKEGIYSMAMAFSPDVNTMAVDFRMRRQRQMVSRPAASTAVWCFWTFPNENACSPSHSL